MNTCDTMQGIRLKAPPLSAELFEKALVARELLSAGWSLRNVAKALAMPAWRVQRLIERLEREERGK